MAASNRNGWRDHPGICSQGLRDLARGVLEPVYARFTEGFATADLAAARALLSDEA
jgi:hypothetical protein